jgi:hypothetical protein
VSDHNARAIDQELGQRLVDQVFAFQIDLTGEASLEMADELEEISNSLNSDEIEYIFEMFSNN